MARVNKMARFNSMARVNEIAKAFKEILPQPASASSSTPTKKVPYDVFINHRGPDTKHTLAASIYRTLKTMGLKVFLDEPELQLGDSIPSEIQDAMTTSFLHIVILSPGYAESPWCLAELSFMLKTGKKIIPVFYDVDPSHIRWIKGTYAKAFSKHEEKARYSSATLEDWKMALQEVSELKGHIVKDEDDEGMLKDIVNYVLKHRENIPLLVAKHPVGLDEIVPDFERSVLKSSENVKIVGIVGMGGCGKTTLAKEYYNKKRSYIYRSSFVCNVQDTSSKNFQEKQKKMFQDLGGSKDISFDNVEEGKAILAEHLRSKQVFIVLDDVDHTDQLDYLLPMKDSLGQGSEIVITSRDFGVLESWGISSNSIYRMKGLKVEHAKELFCWHAFGQSSPLTGFEYLVKEFLKICSGLPLSLKVLGGLVHGKSKEYWDDQLNKVSRLLARDIKDILQVSFEALDREEREQFLDVSCFFIGEKTRLAIEVWNGSGWSGMSGLITLVNKCLAEVDEENCIRMHDHLRDLGRQIASSTPPCRLWSVEQINHMERQPGQESVLIRGIKAGTEEFYEKLMEFMRGSGRRFKPCLEILDVENNYFTEELATLSAGLVWLRWVNFPHTALQSWISLKKLRYLELHEANKLEQLWSETADPPVQLRELKIIRAENFQRFSRSIGLLKHLKRITFDSNGAPIEGLPDEFCCLESLEYLELGGCHKLKSLPSKFGDLTNLRSIRLRGCSGLMTLPASFKQLMYLQYIYFHNCTELIFPSEALAQLTSLRQLDIYNCPGPTEFVIQSGSVSSSLCSLEYTSLWGCRVSRISISPQCCPSLESLSLRDNHHLVEIDSLPISVKYIDLQSCSNLQSISYNCSQVELKGLHISDCGELKKIKGLEHCRSLETLEKHSWGKLPVIQSLKHMESLRSLRLTAASHISAFEPWLHSINMKKRPSECIICGRAAPGVEAIVKSFRFPGLTLAPAVRKKNPYDDGCVYTFPEDYSIQSVHTFSQQRSSNEAVMLCFVINSAYPTNSVVLRGVRYKDGFVFHSNFFDTKMKEGKWVWIGVFTRFPTMEKTWISARTQDHLENVNILRGERMFKLETPWEGVLELEVCPFFHPGGELLHKERTTKLKTKPFFKDEDIMGMLMVGEEKRVGDAAYELFQRLGKSRCRL